MIGLKSITKIVFEKIETFRYHKISNNTAKSVLKNIEKEKGKLPLYLKKASDHYAINTLGWKGYAPWLYVYSHNAGEFKEGWIPDNYYGKKIIPKIQGSYGKISFLKPLNNYLFKKEIGPDLIYFINGLWFNKNYELLKEKDIHQILFSTTDKVICKPDQSFQGKGILVFKEKDFNTNKIITLGNCVIQEFIIQHDFFNRFTTNSVATIRLTTVIDKNNTITLRAAYLRLGRTQNTHITSKDHIRVPINMKNGILSKYGYLSNWRKIFQHPDSKQTFESQIIPNFNDCISLVTDLHNKMPMVRTIGWDVTVNNDNKPVIIEWNGYSNDIKFSEATQGPCFKDLEWEKLRK
ncbi:hypothetical protein KO500_04345 [Cellulophaga baltica]|uniref:sugar-transfer associated ATP-grasp domain-containing protein n=1 Tax=Cellulophaga TaxID=104264 RepID=UPI001C06CEBC|nr:MULTISPECIES: sugar-transfer associated ATP-grasp domain-containing protein [Cellulophaga]MBU2995646.1 hypothetical protein [Cellulophaga baltica]MDO6767040.1 sugar-transfer associated ATP-grasp domain-containing protein [Cellulophaga sp. 1_MG-2023]